MLVVYVILGGCEACNMVGAPDKCFKDLFGYIRKVLFEALLNDGFAVGNFLVDVVVYECCWRGL